jgi:hyperosmotically inducible protein
MKLQFNRTMSIALAAYALATLGATAQAKTLEEEVRHEIAMLPYYGVFDSIGYQVDGGTVTLTGAVHFPVLADDAVQAVKSLAGVAQVKNSIEVLPLSRFDDQIRMAAWRAVYSWPGMFAASTSVQPPVRILVSNGHIRLTGVVLRQADKDALTIRVNALPNVFSVTNDVVVANPSPSKG